MDTTLLRETLMDLYPNMPNGVISKFTMAHNGIDLLCDGLYQVGYSDWLETSTHHSAREMSTFESMIYKDWNDLKSTLRQIIGVP